MKTMTDLIKYSYDNHLEKDGLQIDNILFNDLGIKSAETMLIVLYVMNELKKR